MSALRRQLTATGWQAIGFFGASLIFAAIVFSWGQHIEGRIDTVVIQRQHDHRTLHRLVIHDARVVDGGGALQQPSSTAHQPPSPQHGGPPGHGHAKHPPKSHPTPSPVPSPPAAPSPASPEPSLPPQASPHAEPPGLNHAEPPGLLPSTVEAAGNAAGGAVGKADEALCTVRGLLKPCP